MECGFNFKQGHISYVVEGNGPPVVLIHGFGEDKTIFDKQVGFLKEHCRVIVPDLPGSGSSKLLTDNNVSIDDYADFIYSLLEHENISKCTMLGHSMGGYITLAFAEKYPAFLKGFGFIHSTAFADSEEKKEMRKKGIEAIKQYGAFAFLKNTTPNLFTAKYKQQHVDVVSDLIEKGRQFSDEALIQYYQSMMTRPDRTSVLKNSGVPVLFITGAEDAAAPLNDLLQQVHLPPISHIHILEGVGHMGMLEATDLVNEYILKFISW